MSLLAFAGLDSPFVRLSFAICSGFVAKLLLNYRTWPKGIQNKSRTNPEQNKNKTRTKQCEKGRI